MGARRTQRIGALQALLVASAMLPSSAVAASWSVVQSPNPQQLQGTLIGVSCSAGNACMAVGTGHQATLAERWNGTRWAIEATPNPSPSSSSLQSVSCISASSCMAVGISGGATLSELWNGKSWAVKATPEPTGAQSAILEGVSCKSASSCIAVGYSTTSSFHEFPLAEHWNGTSWAIQTTASLGGATLTKLLGVWCSSASSCTAAGTTGDSSHGGPLAERWNGTSWSIQPTPVPSGTIFNELNGVSCSSATACTAVGDSTSKSFTGAALAERWNGKSWAVQTTPHVSGVQSPLLTGVACGSSSSCTAVGHSFTGGHTVLLAERWNGSSWTVQPTPKPSGGPSGELLGVSCSSASACTAVGGGAPATTQARTLAERSNGSAWAIQSTPNPLATLSSDLDGVSCTSASACTAVGNTTGGTLAERWNGSRWAIQATPNPSGAKSSFLNGVSCTSPSACIGVGESLSFSDIATALAERWNGTRWTILSTPQPSGAQDSGLNGVSCTSASECTAVGEFTNSGGAAVTLAERWNGTSWSIQSTPNPNGAQFSVMNGVSCSSASACTAVGSSGSDAASAATLAEGWNGTSWSIQTTPNPNAALTSALSGVSCSSASACTAVGNSVDNTSFDTAALAERWNGASWALQSTPNPSATFTGLDGVSCTSATDCIAVGDSFPSGNAVTLAEHWDGSKWTTQSTPNASGATSSSLLSVSCTSVSACMAAGSSSQPNHVDTTLTERFTG